MCAIWMTVSECMECTEWPPRQNHSQADKCGKLSFRYCFLWKYLEYLIYSSSRSHWDDLHDGGWLIRLFLAKCGNIITHSWSSIKWSEKARGGKIENTFKIHCLGERSTVSLRKWTIKQNKEVFGFWFYIVTLIQNIIYSELMILWNCNCDSERFKAICISDCKSNSKSPFRFYHGELGILGFISIHFPDDNSNHDVSITLCVCEEFNISQSIFPWKSLIPQHSRWQIKFHIS